MKKTLAVLAKKYKIDLLILFGSAATGRIHKKSDVDIAMAVRSKLSPSNEFTLCYELGSIFKKEIDLVDLKRAPPLLLGQIARDGKLLYGNKKTFDTIRVESMKQYIDFEPYFRMREKYIHHKLSLSHA